MNVGKVVGQGFQKDVKAPVNPAWKAAQNYPFPFTSSFFENAREAFFTQPAPLQLSFLESARSLQHFDMKDFGSAPKEKFIAGVVDVGKRLLVLKERLGDVGRVDGRMGHLNLALGEFTQIVQTLEQNFDIEFPAIELSAEEIQKARSSALRG